MKLRNQLLAFFCLMLFAAFGVFYIRLWVVQKPFGIILFVSDGMVTRHLTTARLYEAGADHRLQLEKFPNLALLANASHDRAVADDAAAATALATGQKVPQGYLATNSKGQALKSILELAKAQGRSIGLVTNGKLTGPAAAAFYAHLADARDADQVALQFAQKNQLDVALGGGSAEFLPEGTNGGLRKDKRNLLNELRATGQEIVSTKAELENAPAYRTHNLVGVFAPANLAFDDQLQADQPSLSDMVRRAIEFMQVNNAGYVLIVDTSLCSQAAETNQGERTLQQTLSLDRAIATADKYAGKKSLILAVGKHSIGGLSLNGSAPRAEHGVALLGINGAGYPSITWATGPNGPTSKTEPSAVQSAQALSTAEDVVAIGKGDGSEKLRGFIDNTAIFNILRDAL